METLGERPVWSMSGGEMVSSLDAVYAEIARLETVGLDLIAGLESTGYAQELGAGTTARLLTLRYRIDALKARRDVHLATTLPKYPAVAAALPEPSPHAAATGQDLPDDAEVAECDASEGERRQGCGHGAGVGVLLHPAQAEAIVTALEKVPATVAPDDLRVAEEQLVELGRTHGPLQLRKAAKLFCDRLDTDGPEPAEDKAYDRESLQLKNAENGVAFSGYLANENAELLRTLVHAHAKPRKTIDGALDPRPRDKRQADALTTILTTVNNPTATAQAAAAPTQTAAASAETTATATGPSHRHGSGFIPGHGPKAHITVTIDFNDLKDATADKIGRLIYGDALSAATIRRLACDAQILPIILGSESQPIDVGTTVRLATGPMRKALIARDRGCVCCGAPPIYCDAHHVKSWIDGGATKLTNLVLLCKRCHRDLHAGHWDIRITNGIVHVTRPTWATPEPIPRGRYRPPTVTLHPFTPGSITVGRSARAWPRDTDPRWITNDDTTRLNPWGDSLEDAPGGGEPAGHIAPQDRLTPAAARPAPSDVDPWGDGGSSTSDNRSRNTPAKVSAAFCPWGDATTRTVAAFGPSPGGEGSTTIASRSNAASGGAPPSSGDFTISRSERVEVATSPAGMSQRSGTALGRERVHSQG